MSDQIMENITPQSTQDDVDRILQDEELMEKILAEQGIDTKKERKSKLNREAVSGVITVISLFVVGVFFISPFIQFIERVIIEAADPEWTMKIDENYDARRVLDIYQQMIQNIHVIVHLMSTILYFICVVKIAMGWKEIKKKLPMYLSRLIPLFIFILFDIGIVLVTNIRGANEYDYSGHPYMFESIYSYILYPISYFFCGMLIGKEKYKKMLLYVLMFTALPLHILAILNEWGVPIRYFIKNGVTLVFHQFNHYGYYIMLSLLTSAMLFFYEKKLWLKCVEFFSIIVCTIILIINDTFGAYLATFGALILFAVYVFVTTRKKKKVPVPAAGEELVEMHPSPEDISEADSVVAVQTEGQSEKKKNTLKDIGKSIITPGSRASIICIIVAFLVITLAMSGSYSNVLKSAVRTVSDVGDIVSDAENSGKAGTGRWSLWVGTAKGIAEKPLTGWGVEGLLNTKKVGTPHNELLQYSAFFGIPVCLLYVAAVLLILWRVIRNQAKMSRTTMMCFFITLGYLASSLVGVAIYYTTPFLYCFLGLTYSEYFNAKEPWRKKKNI